MTREKRNGLIIKMRKAGATGPEIARALAEQGVHMKTGTVLRIAQKYGLKSKAWTHEHNWIPRPPRPTVNNPDAYMARMMKGRVFG